MLQQPWKIIREFSKMQYCFISLMTYHSFVSIFHMYRKNCESTMVYETKGHDGARNCILLTYPQDATNSGRDLKRTSDNSQKRF